MPSKRHAPLPELTVVSGARVRQRREQTGISGRDVTKAAGVSHSMLARWERGVHDPPLTHAVAIARVLGLRLDELMGETPDTPRLREAQVLPAHAVPLEEQAATAPAPGGMTSP